MKQDEKVKRLLLTGILGAILTAVGDCLLLGVDYSGAAGLLGRFIVSAEKVSYTRIGLAGFFGFVGIPLTAMGYGALYELTADRNSRLAKLYRVSVWGYLAFGGAVHVICCYLMTGIKKAVWIGTAADDLLQALLAEQGGFLIPCCLVFFAFYGVNIVAMALLIARGSTSLPKWMVWLNPLLFKLLFNAVGKLGTSAVFNGIACSNMSLGALVILAAWLCTLRPKKTV